MSIRRQEALDYHAHGRPGKIQVSPTKPFKNQRDLSLAYTPGVAEPCREIAARPEEAYTFTAKGNLVAEHRGPVSHHGHEVPLCRAGRSPPGRRRPTPTRPRGTSWPW